MLKPRIRRILLSIPPIKLVCRTSSYLLFCRKIEGMIWTELLKEIADVILGKRYSRWSVELPNCDICEPTPAFTDTQCQFSHCILSPD